jgi:mono/diheme cytochrome c family protein
VTNRPSTAACLILVLSGAAAVLLGQVPAPQNPPAGPQQPTGGGRGGFIAYPQRPVTDPAAVERGKALYGVNCTFCHGADARGGDGGGPNLIRSQVVLDDQRGELLTPVVQAGRPEAGMPKFAALTSAQISDIAAFLHSIPVSSRTGPATIDIVVGDPKAGQAYFQSTCATCHSATDDLRGIASKIADPRMLQQTWLMPGSGVGRGSTAPPPVTVKPATVTVTLPSGQRIEGTLSRLDDFVVSLTEADGTPRSFALDVPHAPQFDVRDPLKPHKDLLKAYTDTDIHNVTAYLVTLK